MTVVHQDCHHAVVLSELSLDPLLDQQLEERCRAERVLNTEVRTFGTCIGWIMKMLDYINRVNITLPLSVYEGTWTTLSPLVAMHHHDLACA